MTQVRSQQDLEKTMTATKRVAIIGGGPSGLTTAKAMLSMGVSATVFEASGDIGGHWNAKSALSGAWENLCMNTNRRMIEFSDFPWEEAVPQPPPGSFAGVFPSVQEAKMYLEAYADAHNLRPHIRTNSRVVKVSKVDTDGVGRWAVEATSDHEQGPEQQQQHHQQQKQKQQQLFDAVVVCSGRYTEPYCPLTLPGGALEHFAGRVVHSRDYKKVEMDLEGKRVLVVGNSISGTEIASEAVIRGASAVFHTMRGQPKYVLPTAMRKPSGYLGTLMEIFFTRMAVYVNRLFPTSWVLSGLQSLVEKVAPRQIDAAVVGPEWAMNPVFAKVGGVAARRDYVGDVNARRIVLKKMPVKADGHTITFGSNAHDDGGDAAQEDSQHVDVVVMATGFQVQLGFLPESVQEDVWFDVSGGGSGGTGMPRDMALFKHTLHPTDPSIFFVGMPNYEAPHFPAAEMQARYAAAIISGHLSRPSASRVRADINAWKTWRLQKGHNVTNAHALEEDIGAVLGVAPTYLTAFWYYKLLVKAPLFPVNYRLRPAVDTPAQTAKDAWARLEQYVRNPTTPVLERV